MRISIGKHLILTNVGSSAFALFLVYLLLSQTVLQQVQHHQRKSMVQVAENLTPIITQAKIEFDEALDYWLRDYHQEDSPLPLLRINSLETSKSIPLYPANTLLIVNSEGKLVSQRWRGAAGSPQWISSPVESLLQQLQPEKIRGLRSGLLFVEQTPLLVALRPVIVTGFETPHILVALTALKPEMLNWANSLGVRAFESIRLVGQPGLGLISLGSIKPELIEPPSESNLPVQISFALPSGEVQFHSTLTMSEVWKSGQRDMRHALIKNIGLFTLLISTIMTTLGVFLYIRPVNRVSRAMRAIRKSQDLSLRVPVVGIFEIRAWAKSFNHLLDQTEKINAALADSEARHRALFEQSPVGTVVFDKNYRLLASNQSFSDMIVLPRESLIGVDISRMVNGTAIKVLDKILSGHSHIYEGPLQSEVAAARLWVSLRMSPIRDNAGQVVAGICMFENLSAQKHAESAFKKERERALATLGSITDAVVTTDIDGTVEYMNPVAEQLTGWASHQVVGRAFNEVCHLIEAETRQPIDLLMQQSMSAVNVGEQSEHDILCSRNGSEFPVSLVVTPLLTAAGDIRGTVVVIHNQTELHGMRQVVAYQAIHDDLTGLKNRKYFEQQVQGALEDAEVTGHTHAVCYLDLDQFKVINDTCGHAAGDELIRQLSRHLDHKVINPSVLARFGGDEFGILLWNMTPTEVEALAEQLRLTVTEVNFEWMGEKYEVGASMGVVLIDETSTSLAEILSTADAACYVAKESGRNRIQMCRPGDTVLAEHYGDMEWVQRIQRAIKEERFCLYSQSILSLKDDHIPHFEILLRMMDDRGGVIAPTSYIRAAERYRLMSAIDHWVIQATLSLLGEVPNLTGRPEFLATINVSGQSLSEDAFLDYVLEQLDKFDVDPRTVCFEITETAVIENIKSAKRFIRVLRKKGIQFALDDFGSGLSSFAYLKELHVDYLKIDGSLVRDIAHNEFDCAMVRAIQEVGRKLNVRTIAEFVENDAILEKLYAMGIDYAQGYAIQKPIPLEINMLKQLQKVALIS